MCQKQGPSFIFPRNPRNEDNLMFLMKVTFINKSSPTACLTKYQGNPRKNWEAEKVFFFFFLFLPSIFPEPQLPSWKTSLIVQLAYSFPLCPSAQTYRLSFILDPSFCPPQLYLVPATSIWR